MIATQRDPMPKSSVPTYFDAIGSLLVSNNIIDKHILLSCSDLAGNITYVTQAYLDFTGYTREEVLGKNHSIFKHPNVDQEQIKTLWKTIKADKTYVGELQNKNKAGITHWIKVTIEPLFNAEGKKIGYCAVREDISDRKSLEAWNKTDVVTELYNRRYFNEIFANVFAHAKEQHTALGFVLFDIDYFDAYNLFYTYQRGDILLFKIAQMLREIPCSKKNYLFRLGGGEFGILIENITQEELEAYTQNLQKQIAELKIEHATSKISEFVTVSIGATSVLLQEGHYSLHDIYNIADQNLFLAKQSGRNAVKLSTHLTKSSELAEIDVTTQLPTRVVLNNDLASLQEDAMLILLFINDFSHYHEHYGNDFIDNLLVQKAKILRQFFAHESITIYRLNVNEFAILVRDKIKFDFYFSILIHSVLASRICCDLEEKENVNIAISYTAGVAYGKDQILRKANHALQNAFLSTKNYAVYEESQTQNNLKIDKIKNLNTYQKALENDNIIPYFQPLVDARTEKTIKYEALARIIDNKGNIVPPYLFLDVAREDKTFENFTRQLLQKIFIIASKNPTEFSINLTYQNIISEDLVSYIKNRLEKYGGSNITFEIIESEEIQDYKQVNRFISEVKTYGCKIAIDDFGSGYSNFTNLIKLDIDYIKIDGSIIEKLHLDKNVETMAKSLIGFAKETGIKTIAEFVSSKEIVQKVKELEIDLLQGYYFGEPLPPEGYSLIV